MQPCAGDGFVKLGTRYPVVFDEIQERFAHPLNCGLDVEFDEIEQVSLVIELRGRDGTGFEGRAKVAIVLG